MQRCRMLEPRDYDKNFLGLLGQLTRLLLFGQMNFIAIWSNDLRRGMDADAMLHTFVLLGVLMPCTFVCLNIPLLCSVGSVSRAMFELQVRPLLLPRPTPSHFTQNL
jgi:hypothetical protein